MGDQWPRDGDDREQVVQSLEVVGIGREERELLGDGDGRGHQVGDPAPGLAARADHRGGDPAVDPGGLCAEGDGVELCSALLRTWFGLAESSANVIAVIAMSAGSSSTLIQRRSTMMLVSRIPDT
ncbi:hypothetical protein ABT337_23855 [Saccharopolyspora hirsuta]|uniref:hypothetical protein n=1 Tax=Saccharopolyspora hirsuta TaxID=1837 RepID=UPI001BA8EDA2|nr:hypothetical protein [Saccharopolyspora hirsuta]